MFAISSGICKKLESGKRTPDIIHYRLIRFTGKDLRKVSFEKKRSALGVGKTPQLRVKGVRIFDVRNREFVCADDIFARDIKRRDSVNLRLWRKHKKLRLLPAVHRTHALAHVDRSAIDRLRGIG